MKMSFNLPDDLATELKKEADAGDTTYSSMLASILRQRYLQSSQLDHSGYDEVCNQIRFLSLLLQDDDIPISKQKALQKEVERTWSMIKAQL